MFLKVQQAIKHMRNHGLNIKEISKLSGFTDEKRMAECFKRMFGIPPGKYRLKYIINKNNKYNLSINHININIQ